MGGKPTQPEICSVLCGIPENKASYAGNAPKRVTENGAMSTGGA